MRRHSGLLIVACQQSYARTAQDVGIAQNSPAQLLAALLSGKRSLDGNAGKCPATCLQNELSDNKVDG
ncbi:MAG: hypothetical protein ABL933_02485, partial [Methyloglobulus sp.]